MYFRYLEDVKFENMSTDKVLRWEYDERVIIINQDYIQKNFTGAIHIIRGNKNEYSEVKVPDEKKLGIVSNRDFIFAIHRNREGKINGDATWRVLQVLEDGWLVLNPASHFEKQELLHRITFGLAIAAADELAEDEDRDFSLLN